MTARNRNADPRWDVRPDIEPNATSTLQGRLAIAAGITGFLTVPWGIAALACLGLATDAGKYWPALVGGALVCISHAVFFGVLCVALSAWRGRLNARAARQAARERTRGEAVAAAVKQLAATEDRPKSRHVISGQ